MIFAIGLAPQCPRAGARRSEHVDWSRLRIPGVLQRIAVCYLVASLIELFAGHPGARSDRGRRCSSATGCAMTLIARPRAQAGDLSRRGNLAAFVDRAAAAGAHLQADLRPRGAAQHPPRGGDDPHRRPRRALAPLGAVGRSRRTRACSSAGWFGVLLGWVWGAVFPINKALWTSSYVLLTGGPGLAGLAVCYWLVDIPGFGAWSRPFAVFGMNAIAAFVLSGLIARSSAWRGGTTRRAGS